MPKYSVKWEETRLSLSKSLYAQSFLLRDAFQYRLDGVTD